MQFEKVLVTTDQVSTCDMIIIWACTNVHITVCGCSIAGDYGMLCLGDE